LHLAMVYICTIANLKNQIVIVRCFTFDNTA
jgi:hypothetical protein